MRFDSIHNYYETLVVREIIDHFAAEIKTMDEDHLQDIACIALNRLPARYVRHQVDLSFALMSDEREEIEKKVTDAVEFAIDKASKYQHADR